MQLRFINSEGRQVEYDLNQSRPVVLGRAPEADLVIADDKASRLHAEIRFWAGDYVAKDLQSRNGTLLNEMPISVAVLHPGDTIRIGQTNIVFDHRPQKGANTILREVGRDFEEGKKGYRTVLREIVSSTGSRERTRKNQPKPRGPA